MMQIKRGRGTPRQRQDATDRQLLIDVIPVGARRL